MSVKCLSGVAFALGLFAATSAGAASQNFSFTGNFSFDNDVQLLKFSVAETSTVTIRTYSYAGGTMADGSVISAGGFDPTINLWDGDGNYIDDYGDGPEDVPVDPVTEGNFDVYAIVELDPGDYIISLTQYYNDPESDFLSDGFDQANPFYTNNRYPCSNGVFCDYDESDTGFNRTSFWALDVLNVESAEAQTSVVPLPAALPLMLSGLAFTGLIARRRKSA